MLEKVIFKKYIIMIQSQQFQVNPQQKWSFLLTDLTVLFIIFILYKPKGELYELIWRQISHTFLKSHFEFVR